MSFDRPLPREEVYDTFSFSPLRGESGAVEGLFCACTETTERLLGTGRLDALRRLGVEAAVARSVADACAAAVKVLSHNPLGLIPIVLLPDRTGQDAPVEGLERAELARKVGELRQANREAQDARRAALNVMEDALEAKDALRQADRRKDEFLATLAHELRDPLAPIQNGLPPDPPGRRPRAAGPPGHRASGRAAGAAGR